jgi:hypothetical protein
MYESSPSQSLEKPINFQSQKNLLTLKRDRLSIKQSLIDKILKIAAPFKPF